VGDHHERLRRLDQELLELEDAFEVEVVGRLVEQQQVGLAGDLAGDGEALLPERAPTGSSRSLRSRKPSRPSVRAARASFSYSSSGSPASAAMTTASAVASAGKRVSCST
jgi:hypothetical protein